MRNYRKVIAVKLKNENKTKTKSKFNILHIALNSFASKFSKLRENDQLTMQLY